MHIRTQTKKRVRIEMLPLIDIVFLILVFFIYAALSMAVHRGIPVLLPKSTTAKIDKKLIISVTVKADGTIYLDKEPVSLDNLSRALEKKAGKRKETGVLLFSDRSLPYQKLFQVLDRIRMAGLTRISLQAEVDKQQ
ncbi:MAG: biopolymer transporter ExbD [Deltaproteobacteria bacterium]|nr:biopolymer transporter ExbD [Deltaproteobacteria bacterium]